MQRQLENLCTSRALQFQFWRERVASGKAMPLNGFEACQVEEAATDGGGSARAKMSCQLHRGGIRNLVFNCNSPLVVVAFGTSRCYGWQVVLQHNRHRLVGYTFQVFASFEFASAWPACRTWPSDVFLPELRWLCPRGALTRGNVT